MKQDKISVFLMCAFAFAGGAAVQLFFNLSSAQAENAQNQKTETYERIRTPVSSPLQMVEVQGKVIKPIPRPVVTNDLSLMHQDLTVADLCVDGSCTKMELRDPKGRLGLVLRVSEIQPNRRGMDNTNMSRRNITPRLQSQIEFYDGQGKRIAVLDGNTRFSGASQKSSEVKIPELNIHYTIGKADYLDDIWAAIRQLDTTVTAMKKAMEAETND